MTMDHIVRAAPGGCEIAVEMRASAPLEVALRASYGPVVALWSGTWRGWPNARTVK